MSPTLDSAFDGGNAVVRSIGNGEVRIAVRPDGGAEFLQWFSFRLDDLDGSADCRVVVENAAETTYPKGWEGYGVATSTDLVHWYRTPTEYDGRTLSWRIDRARVPNGPVWFAYFAPHSLSRHDELVARSVVSPGVSHERLGSTGDGRAIDCLSIGAMRSGRAAAPEARRLQLWAIARQHPGESMAAWWMEGWLERLLDENDATSRALRELADIHSVPNMNPDGTFRGNLRTNASGANLNREWADPSPERSPEVFHVRRRMHETGVDLALDIHGDEALPYNFIAGTEGVPSWNEERDAELIAFKHTLASLNPDFQTVHGYPRTPPGKANLSYASNYIAETFCCPAMTLEMPFKDTADTPRPDVGWSPERCKRLGRSFVDAVYLSLCGRLLRPPA